MYDYLKDSKCGTCTCNQLCIFDLLHACMGVVLSPTYRTPNPVQCECEQVCSVLVPRGGATGDKR